MLTARAAEPADVVRGAGLYLIVLFSCGTTAHAGRRWSCRPPVGAPPGLAHSVSAQTVRRTIAGLDVSDRTLLVSQELDSSLRRGSAHDNDVAVRAALAQLTSAPVLRELHFADLLSAAPRSF